MDVALEILFLSFLLLYILNIDLVFFCCFYSLKFNFDLIKYELNELFILKEKS